MSDKHLQSVLFDAISLLFEQLAISVDMRGMNLETETEI